MPGAQGFHIATMLERREDQGDDADTDHQRRILSRPQDPFPWPAATLLFLHVLKELIDRETKTDQRRRRPDPRHQRPIVGQARPVGR